MGHCPHNIKKDLENTKKIFEISKKMFMIFKIIFIILKTELLNTQNYLTTLKIILQMLKMIFSVLKRKHCTIGYAMKIKKKKMFKSKHLVFAHFSTKTVDFFVIDGKIPMFCHKYFLKSKM